MSSELNDDKHVHKTNSKPKKNGKENHGESNDGSLRPSQNLSVQSAIFETQSKLHLHSTEFSQMESVSKDLEYSEAIECRFAVLIIAFNKLLKFYN